MLHDYSKQRKFQNTLRTWEMSVLYYLKYRIRRPEVFSSCYFSYFSLTLTNKYLHRVIMHPRKLFKPLVLARAISFPNFGFRKNKWLGWSIRKLSDRRNIGQWLSALRWWLFNWIWWRRLVTFFYRNYICYFTISHFSSLSSQTLQKNTKFAFFKQNIRIWEIEKIMRTAMVLLSSAFWSLRRQEVGNTHVLFFL